jgi:hypothetical protein
MPFAGAGASAAYAFASASSAAALAAAFDLAAHVAMGVGLSAAGFFLVEVVEAHPPHLHLLVEMCALMAAHPRLVIVAPSWLACPLHSNPFQGQG